MPDSSYLGKHYEQFGCIETLSAGPGIVRRALAAMEGDGQTILREVAGGDLKALTAEKVFEAARSGDLLAQGVVDETVDYLSIIVASAAAILNPELIVLGGGIARSADLLIEPIRQRVEGVVPVMPLIKASELGENAAVMGAIALVLHSTDDVYLSSRA